MKKILLLILLLFLFINTTISTFALTNEEKINSVGKNLLEKNNISSEGITFIFTNEDVVNAYATWDKKVNVYKGLYDIIETDEELAAVIAHELGHILNKHILKQSAVVTITNYLLESLSKKNVSNATMYTTNVIAEASFNKLSRTDEYDADLTGTELLIRAGYNPLAMLSLLQKIDNRYIDLFHTHPSGEKRTLNVYDYLTVNYPNSIKNKNYNTDSYKEFYEYYLTVEKQRNSSKKEAKKVNKQKQKLKDFHNKKIKILKKMQK